MVTNTSITVESILDDNKISRSFGYINPTATDAQIRAFATGVYNLSNQMITAIYKLVRTDITLSTEENGDGGHNEASENVPSDGTV